MKTPITYYGGKQQMLRYILPLIPNHRIYDEPFFGGGAVFWGKKPSSIEFINDHNSEVVNFYRVLKLNFQDLKKEINSTLYSEHQYKEAVTIYFNHREYSEVKRAWALWVLSHQSFNAVIGNNWRCSKGRSLASQLQESKELFTDLYSKRMENASIFCREALDVIKKTDEKDTFHYIDPPYYQADMGHYGDYKIGDFDKLLRLLSTIEGKFMLSSYPSEILNRYIVQNNWKMLEYELPRPAGGGKKIEVLTMNYQTRIAKEMELFAE